jgi:hypothetical protein
VQNYIAAQIESDGLSVKERKMIEGHTGSLRPDSNYFMTFDKVGLSGPRDANLIENKVTWYSAIAGDDPISHYEVCVNGELIGKVEHQPQKLKSKPFLYELENQNGEIVITAIDKAGNRATSRIS